MKGSRLLHLALVLAGISLGTFALLELAPGDPAEIILRSRHEAPAPDRIAALRASLGLDDPWPLRYGRWLGRLGQGDLGRSWASGRPVGQEIAARAGATLELALGAFVLVLILSSASGAWAAWKRGRAPDQALRAASVLFAALPNYWLGLLLIYFLAMKAHWFPVMGRGGLEHLFLPALSLALAVAVLQGRVLRATLLQVMSADHIRFARAKGLGPWHIFSRHLLRNALPPLVTVWGVSLGQLLGGAVIVESVFAWPGLGQLLVQSVLSRDLPVVQALVLLLALIFVAVNLLVDLMQTWLDPRVGRAS